MRIIKMSLLAFITWIVFEFVIWDLKKRDYVANRANKECGLNKECAKKIEKEYYALMHII